MRDSFARFPSTQWSLIRGVQQTDVVERRRLLNELIIRYWKPVYALYRSMGKSPADASDLTQGFLTMFLQNENFTKLGIHTQDPSQPTPVGDVRFRSWLKQCSRNYLYSSWRKENAHKRSPGSPVISLHALCARDGQPIEIASDVDPNKRFFDCWRRDIIDKASKKVKAECQKLDEEGDYYGINRVRCLEIFIAFYIASPEERPGWKDIAREFELSDKKQASTAADWVKRQFQKAIRDEISEYTDDVEAELAELLFS